MCYLGEGRNRDVILSEDGVYLRLQVPGLAHHADKVTLGVLADHWPGVYPDL